MTNERIKNVSMLPKWFELAKYDATKELDAAGWYEQLHIRKSLQSLLAGAQRRPAAQNALMLLAGREATRHSLKTHILPLVFASPIVDVGSNTLLHAYFCNLFTLELRAKKPVYSLGVRQTTMNEFYLTEALIEREKRDYARAVTAIRFDEQRDPTKKLNIQKTSWMNEPVDDICELDTHEVNVRVNLQVPDKLLIDQFQDMLKAIRKRNVSSGITAEPTKKIDFDAWCTFAILPYLDLKIWADMESKQIPVRVMADAIFPPGEQGEDTVRKTTIPTAKALLTTKHLATLASAAAQEIAERNLLLSLP